MTTEKERRVNDDSLLKLQRSYSLCVFLLLTNVELLTRTLCPQLRLGTNYMVNNLGRFDYTQKKAVANQASTKPDGKHYSEVITHYYPPTPHPENNNL